MIRRNSFEIVYIFISFLENIIYIYLVINERCYDGYSTILKYVRIPQILISENHTSFSKGLFVSVEYDV